MLQRVTALDRIYVEIQSNVQERTGSIYVKAPTEARHRLLVLCDRTRTEQIYFSARVINTIRLRKKYYTKALRCNMVADLLSLRILVTPRSSHSTAVENK